MKKINFLKGTICLAVSLCLALSSIPVLAEEELPGAAMDIEVSESSDNSDTLAEDETVETEDSLTEEFMGEDIEPSETLPEIEISSEKANHAADAVMTAEKTAALSISVDYTENISCGQEIIFTVNASGGSGNYKYRLASLMTVEDGQLVSVYDISYGNNGSYRENNEFGFTFYASGTYYIRFSVMDMTTFETKTTGLYEYALNIQDANYPSVVQIVKTVAAQCKNECATDFEKALWLHDWILDKGDYDYSYSYCSAEGVLARGKGTCESYHRAYVLLLNEVGIATGRITGNGHVWTAVKMDGEWYQVDTTWDDGGEQMQGTIYEHMYFGLTDEIIGLVHTDHQSAVPGYESTALENNYFIKTGQIKQWSDPFVDTIKQNLANGEIKFVLNVNSSMPGNFKNVIYNLVAYELSKTDWNGKKLDISYADDCLTCEVKAGADDETVTYYVTYDANGGSKAPANQVKNHGTELILSSLQPTKNYMLTYNVNGGNLDSKAKQLSAVFRSWNTKADGSGTAYVSGGSYTQDMSVTLYAQWTDPKAGTLATPTRSGYTFDGWYTASSGGSKVTSGTTISKDMTLYARWSKKTDSEPQYKDDVEAFVAQLYKVCLSRNPDAGGLNTWTTRLKNKQETGISAAYGFVFSNEFKAKNLCNEDYVEQLYAAFMGRKADASGKATWINLLESGTTREEVFNGFALSKEFEGLCNKYGIEQGKGVEIPKFGTIPTDACGICGKEDGVTGFVTRLYKVCLNRKPDTGGLKDWRTRLCEHTSSGREVAYGFIFSQEFICKKYSNADYVEHLYEAFMGRSSDAAGKKMWVDYLNKGWSREKVFDGFVGSDEFTKICNSYGIVRD